jgi:hypothetical protein
VAGPAVLDLGTSELSPCTVVLINGRMVFMAAQTPAHGHLTDSLGNGHVVLDLAVTFLTDDSSENMTFVAEVHEVREVVDLYPRDDFTALVVADQFLELGTTLCAHATFSVAVHADPRAGHMGMDGASRSGVAVLTVDLQLTSMKHVRIVDGLLKQLIMIDRSVCHVLIIIIPIGIR